MLKLSRLQVISDIELIINRPAPALGQRKWTSKGAACSIDRHSFAGEIYSFYVEILQIRLPATGRPSWKLLIVREFWQGSDGESIPRNGSRLGKPADVLKWISANQGAIMPGARYDLRSGEVSPAGDVPIGEAARVFRGASRR